jgi:hypothetical protein
MPLGTMGLLAALAIVLLAFRLYVKAWEDHHREVWEKRLGEVNSAWRRTMNLHRNRAVLVYEKKDAAGPEITLTIGPVEKSQIPWVDKEDVFQIWFDGFKARNP